MAPAQPITSHSSNCNSAKEIAPGGLAVSVVQIFYIMIVDLSPFTCDRPGPGQLAKLDGEHRNTSTFAWRCATLCSINSSSLTSWSSSTCSLADPRGLARPRSALSEAWRMQATTACRSPRAQTSAPSVALGSRRRSRRASMGWSPPRRPLRHACTCMAAQLLGRDTVHLAPTGSGKSLCFLLDALAGAVCGPTVVISPLQSLIRSQAATVEAWLRVCGTDGRVLHELADYVIDSVGGEQTDVGEQRLDSLEQALVPGSLAWSIVHDRSLRVIYVTPEKLASPSIAAALANAAPFQYVVDACARPARSPAGSHPLRGGSRSSGMLTGRLFRAATCQAPSWAGTRANGVQKGRHGSFLAACWRSTSTIETGEA